MKLLLALTCFGLTLATVSASAADKKANRDRHVSLQSVHLSTPIDGCTRITLVADLEDSEGRGHMEFDPNACTLNVFGDREICTEIAPETRTVVLNRMRTEDPLRKRRQHWSITGHPLRGSLSLIVPHDPSGTYRLVYTSRNDNRIAITMEPLVWSKNPEAKEAITKTKCDALARTVDGFKAQTSVNGGIINETYLLTIVGKKPNLNTWADIRPLVYTKKPDYWEIKVLDCRNGGIVIPQVSGYTLLKEISQTVGHKGIKLIWANGDTEQIEIP